MIGRLVLSLFKFCVRRAALVHNRHDASPAITNIYTVIYAKPANILCDKFEQISSVSLIRQHRISFPLTV